MIKIEIPANRPDIAAAMGRALLEIGGLSATASVTQQPEPSSPCDQVDDAETVPDDENESAGFSGGKWAAMRVDLHGVPFDERYCGNAAEPFYATGKQSGQWKKRKGVSEETYAAWYDAALANSNPVGAVTTEEQCDTTPATNTAAAFGGVQPSAVKRPTTTGEYMAWVSEKQAAGNLTQPTIQAAYAQLGLGVTSLFPPTPTEVVASHVANLYDLLSQTAGA